MRISYYPIVVVFVILVAAGCEEGHDSTKVIGTVDPR